MASATHSYGALEKDSIVDNNMDGAANRSSIQHPSENSPSLRQWTSIALVVSIALVGGLSLVHHNHVQLSRAASAGFLFSTPDRKTIPTSLPMPHGVNVGSWLSLEDYFFAGKSAVEVATPDAGTAAVCLPPLHTGSSTGPTWHAETDLLQNLAAQTTLGHALRVFHAHRNAFLDFEEDLATLKQLGITSIRVPISWCLTNDDPAKIDPKDTDIAGLEDRFTCRDPFFEGVLWPASKLCVYIEVSGQSILSFLTF